MRTSGILITARNGGGVALLLAMLLALGMVAHLPGPILSTAGPAGTERDTVHQPGDEQVPRTGSSSANPAVRARPVPDRDADRRAPIPPATTTATAAAERAGAARPALVAPWQTDPWRGPPSA